MSGWSAPQQQSGIPPQSAYPPQPPAPPPMQAPEARAKRSGLAIAAIGLAAVALVIALIDVAMLPGPAGLQGLPGDTGPVGPRGTGTILSTSSRDFVETIGPGCVNYLSITITVPSAGTVVVQAQNFIAVDHSLGTRDLVNLLLSTIPTACGIGPYLSAVDVAANAPTDTTFHGIFMQRPFPVASTGTYTFYYNGVMAVGQNAADEFYYSNMVAVFYPS